MGNKTQTITLKPPVVLPPRTAVTCRDPVTGKTKTVMLYGIGYEDMHARLVSEAGGSKGRRNGTASKPSQKP